MDSNLELYDVKVEKPNPTAPRGKRPTKTKEDSNNETEAAQVSKVKVKSNTYPDAFADVVIELKAVIIDKNNRRSSAHNSKDDLLKEKDKDEERSTSTLLTNNKIVQMGEKPTTTLCKKNSDLQTRPNKFNQDTNFIFTGFEKLKGINSVSMSLDWINFKIKNENGEELFQAVQSKYCSLTVTGRNELFVRKINAENILRIHSNTEEDIRNFHLYTVSSSEKHVGTISCNVRQTFKLPSTIKNKISGRIYNVSVQHDGESKLWEIDDINSETTVASVKVQLGHRWKSVYTLTFIQETSISSQVLIVGFLLALASARLESEIVPAFFAFSAVIITFIIFFIVQFT